WTIRRLGLRRQCSSLEWADLIQEGVFGLARAIEGFDLSRGAEFSTYAVHWIRSWVQRSVETKDLLIRVPSHRWQDRASRSEARQRFGVVLSLSANDLGCARDLKDCRRPDPAQVADDEDFARTLAEKVHRFLACLHARDRDIVALRFGLAGIPKHTLEEV